MRLARACFALVLSLCLLLVAAPMGFGSPSVRFAVDPSHPTPCASVSVSAYVDFPDACYELVSFSYAWTAPNHLSIFVTVQDTNPPRTYCALVIKTLGSQASLGLLPVGHYSVDARFYLIPYGSIFPNQYTTGSTAFEVSSSSTSGIKLLPDGLPACLNSRAVTYAAPDFFYIEEDSRASGIRVEKVGHGLSVGMRADVQGTITTNSNKERCIAATWTAPSGTGTVAPLFVTNPSIGGGNWCYNAVNGQGQIGVSGAKGLCNVGLLVRLQGKVIPGGDTQAIYIDDGSGYIVRVALPAGTSPPACGTRVIVTGVVSCLRETVGGMTYQRRTVLARSVAAL